MDLSVELFALTMLVVMGVACGRSIRRPFDVLLTLALLRCTVVWVLAPLPLLESRSPGDPSHPRAAHRPRGRLCGPPRRRITPAAGGGHRPGRAALAASSDRRGPLCRNGDEWLSFLSFGGSQIGLIKDFGTLMALGLALRIPDDRTLVPAAVVCIDRRGRRAAIHERRRASGRFPDGKGRADRASSRVEARARADVDTSVRHPVQPFFLSHCSRAPACLAATTARDHLLLRPDHAKKNSKSSARSTSSRTASRRPSSAFTSSSKAGWTTRRFPRDAQCERARPETTRSSCRRGKAG